MPSTFVALRDVRLLLAGGIADDSRQVDDRVDAVERLLHRRGVADVALDQLKVAVLAARQQAVAAEAEAVQHADMVAQIEQHRDQRGPDITSAAGDENPHDVSHPWLRQTRLAASCPGQSSPLMLSRGARWRECQAPLRAAVTPSCERSVRFDRPGGGNASLPFQIQSSLRRGDTMGHDWEPVNLKSGTIGGCFDGSAGGWDSTVYALELETQELCLQVVATSRGGPEDGSVT